MPCGSNSRRGDSRRQHFSQHLQRRGGGDDRAQSQGSPRAIYWWSASARYVFATQWLAGSSRCAAGGERFELSPLREFGDAQPGPVVPAYPQLHLAWQVLSAQLATGDGTRYHGVFRLTAVVSLCHSFCRQSKPCLLGEQLPRRRPQDLEESGEKKLPTYHHMMRLLLTFSVMICKRQHRQVTRSKGKGDRHHASATCIECSRS